jgi:polysaccharide pyruvyl transferase WcaK-like protein
MKKRNTICLLGASFGTGNLGVSALAWSSIKLILHHWPEAEVCIVGAGWLPSVYVFNNGGKAVNVYSRPVRYTPKVWVQDHILWIWFAVWMVRLLPFLKKRIENRDSTLAMLLKADVICDITGGDSFSDIYGMGRFVRGYLLKRICQKTGNTFMMLPQTYGPFKSRLVQILASKILNRAEKIYSRDQEGLAVVEKLAGKSDRIVFCPDVAFVLDAVRPENEQARQIEILKTQHNTLVGLNISGLVYNGGYTQNNMFGLACNYPLLIRNIISYYARQVKHFVLLVPHVVPRESCIEDDYAVCRKAWQSLPPAEQERVIVIHNEYDQNQMKYLIGLCDFFIGARMHATIAALSQGIPAVGMAYSKKFSGVFETAGVLNCVVDMRKITEEEILYSIKKIYENKDIFRRQLTEKMPEIKKKVMSLFDGFEK